MGVVITVAFIALLFTIGIGLLISEWRRPNAYKWTPFDGNGYVDHERLKNEGWHTIGAMIDEEPGVTYPKTQEPSPTYIFGDPRGVRVIPPKKDDR